MGGWVVDMLRRDGVRGVGYGIWDIGNGIWIPRIEFWESRNREWILGNGKREAEH